MNVKYLVMKKPKCSYGNLISAKPIVIVETLTQAKNICYNKNNDKRVKSHYSYVKVEYIN